MNENGNARSYEIVDKVTGEVLPVSRLGSGDADNDQDMDFLTHKEDGTEVVFTQPGYVNEQYLVRDVETKMLPDGSAVVEDVLPEYTGEMANYKILGKIEYSDEKGAEKLGELEIGSVQSLPVVLGDSFVADGLAERVVETPSNEGASVQQAPVEETVAVSNVPAEPRKFFEGKVVISDGTRDVNGITYHAIRLEDGSMYDLTAEDYKLKVTVEEL